MNAAKKTNANISDRWLRYHFLRQWQLHYKRIRIRMHIHTNMCTYMYIYEYECIHACMYIYMYAVYMNEYIHIYKYSGTTVIERFSSRSIQSSTQRFWVKVVAVIEQMVGVRTHGLNRSKQNNSRGKPNTTERLAESTRTVSVSISPSWSPIERVSDIVFLQIPRFVCVDSLRFVYFNLYSWALRRFNWAQAIEKRKKLRRTITLSFYGERLPFKLITLPPHKSTLHYFLSEVLFQLSNKSVVEQKFGTNHAQQPGFYYMYIYIYIYSF